MLNIYADAAEVAERNHSNLLGQSVEIKLVGDTLSMDPVQTPAIPPGTILVKGLNSTQNEQVLELYFSNTNCGGGEIAQVAVNGNNAYVTFADPQGNDSDVSIILACLVF